MHYSCTRMATAGFKGLIEVGNAQNCLIPASCNNAVTCVQAFVVPCRRCTITAFNDTSGMTSINGSNTGSVFCSLLPNTTCRPVNPLTPTAAIYTVSQKNKQNYFCYNYVKLPPNPTIFCTTMANCLELYEALIFHLT